MKKTFQIQWWISIGLFLLIFLAAPTNTAQKFLIRLGISIQSYYGLVLFLSIIYALFAYLLYRVFSQKDGDSADSIKPLQKTYPTNLFWLKAIVSFAILLRALFALDGPMDWDEKETASILLQTPFSTVLNPVRSREILPYNKNHTVAVISSYLWGKVFGHGRISLRFPSIVFLVLFLFVLYHFSNRFISPIPTVLLYVHLLLNQNFMNYAHALKGYMSLCFFALLSLHLIQKALTVTPLHRRDTLLLGVAFLGTAFSHTFGAIYNLLLIFSLACWIAFEKSVSHSSIKSRAKRLLLYSLLTLPIMAAVLVNHFSHLITHGNILELGAHLISFYGGILGNIRIWWGKIILLFIVCSALYQFLKKRKTQNSYLGYFTLNTIIFVSLTIWVLEVSFLENRFFLAFLVPYVIWLSESALAFSLPTRRWALGLVTLFLWVLPPFYIKQVYDAGFFPRDLAFYQFVKRVKQKPKSEQSCYSFSGSAIESKWSGRLYFFDRLIGKSQKDCSEHLHLYLTQRNNPPNLDVIGPHAKELLSDADGRRLYLIP